jgi:hypothetical protein
MNDTEFLAAVENATIPHFPHHAHIRMAWLYLRAHEWDSALHNIKRAIQTLDHKHSLHGKPPMYHETLTVFWAKAVAKAIAQTPHISDFEQFSAQHPRLFNSRYANEFYSAGVLWSDEARRVWVEPDVKALPV